ncbi:hypothetical protein [Frateuria sp.]|uniref:hypothetical protein n=1 Tax=Frateuria sp. TaxID=2211372 RepID=UPI003F80F071
MIVHIETLIDGKSVFTRTIAPLNVPNRRSAPAGRSRAGDQESAGEMRQRQQRRRQSKETPVFGSPGGGRAFPNRANVFARAVLQPLRANDGE